MLQQKQNSYKNGEKGLMQSDSIIRKLADAFFDYSEAEGCIVSVNCFANLMKDMPQGLDIEVGLSSVRKGLYGKFLGKYIIVSTLIQEDNDFLLFIGNWSNYLNQEWVDSYHSKTWEQLVSEMKMNEALE